MRRLESGETNALDKGKESQFSPALVFCIFVNQAMSEWMTREVRVCKGKSSAYQRADSVTSNACRVSLAGRQW